VQVVLFDGQQYKWEDGPNRRLQPAALRTSSGVTGWAEVVHLLYWDSTVAHGGHTPAVVIPRHAPAPKKDADAAKSNTADQQDLTAVQLTSLFSTFDGDEEESREEAGSPHSVSRAATTRSSHHSRGTDNEMVSAESSLNKRASLDFQQPRVGPCTEC
jgi:hypothetical protein